MELTNFQSKIYNFLINMKDIYKKKSKDKIISDRIQRGTKSPISDFFEEEFTILLSELLDGKYTFIIDFQLSKYSRKDGSYKQHFKPDILVLEKVDSQTSKVCAIFELKLDISYASDDWIREMHDRVKLFEQFNVKYRLYKTKNNQNTGKLELEINKKNIPQRTEQILLNAKKNLKLLGIVLCRENDHYNRWKSVTDSSKYDNVQVFYLSDKHLNNPSVNLNKVLEENRDYWEQHIKRYLVDDMGLVMKE